jgi:hypothetical protein
MKKLFHIILLFCTIFVLVKPVQSGVDFLMEFKPGSLLLSPDLDGFSVYHYGGWTSYEDRVEGVGSFLPRLNLGIGISVPVIYIDITGGVGVLINGGIIAPFYTPDLAIKFKLGRFITLGPHIGMLFMNPTWNGQNSDSEDVEFSADTGFNTGLCFTAGHPKVGFSMTLDYVSQTFNVETFNEWYGPDELDMSGFSINLGLYLRL